ncbi:lipoamide acyltransferase component of branched-chain alpha-keto acid dehydrogenase complex [Alicyclobacillus contaminans]|uniref:dihydrolipoamide acetyltransferase family protein n=1 Tax=Alicyclobacillus contaminans TaxID=392016 RepID=UPI00041D92B0|nr:dihydrolipoamide acetyltransferase family protein [Alicyclobacillus contaminans]GMA52446.1 lipoamide acyltransferase component of branched-chain alpha-keto acid dehydrogenase complex [Alicyclobacillus contaminans]
MADVKMPQLGESVTEGTLGKWLKAPGDKVEKYEPLVEVITDKVTAEVPSDFAGTLAEIVVPEGETVTVGTVICRIAEEGDATSGASSEGPAADAQVVQAVSPISTEKKHATERGAVRRYSPAVLRLAEEHQIDLSRLEGTGEGGRITRKDVLAYVQRRSAATASVSTEGENRTQGTVSRPTERADFAPMPPTSPLAPSGDEDVQRIEPSPIRRTIARRMVESKRNAPHAWTMVEADVTRLVALRTAVKADFKRREGIDLTYLPFFIKAVVEGLKQYPMLNAAWIDDKIVMHQRINISIAVATDDALAVPVIHNADRLSIAGLAHAVNELAAKARSGRLSMQDVQGGTFTVNNTGAFGSILSQPIINAPQAAILSVESIVKRPVVVDDAIAIRSMVNLCLSLDHRLLDGWIAGQFLKAVRERLQSFGPDTVLY